MLVTFYPHNFIYPHTAIYLIVTHVKFYYSTANAFGFKRIAKVVTGI